MIKQLIVLSLLISHILIIPHSIGELAKRLDQQKNHNVYYTLFARPKGSFGAQLGIFWDVVKADRRLRNKIAYEPPHCTLITCFKGVKSGHFYAKALQKALLKHRHDYRGIEIESLSQENGHDYIKLSSDFLGDVASEFAQNAGINQIHIVNPAMYCITLRECNYKREKDKQKVHKLEKRIELDAKVGWTVNLYRRTEKRLVNVAEFKL